MPKKPDTPANRRRFSDSDKPREKVWEKEQREEYVKRRDSIAPFIRDLTTPPPEEKKKDFWSELLG